MDFFFLSFCFRHGRRVEEKEINKVGSTLSSLPLAEPIAISSQFVDNMVRDSTGRMPELQNHFESKQRANGTINIASDSDILSHLFIFSMRFNTHRPRL